MWNEDIARAVGGDARRHLERVRMLADGAVRWRGERIGDGRGKGKRRENGQGGKSRVLVPMPVKWGMFVIRGEDGRVVVVGREGEFDSGPVGGGQVDRGMRGQKNKEKERGRKETDNKRNGKKMEGKRGHTGRKREVLTPIRESSDEYDYTGSRSDDEGSLTGFFMTGGASGWPSRTATPESSSSSDTIRHDTSDHTSPARTKTSLRSPPGGWPSPPLSPVHAWGGGNDDTQGFEDRSISSSSSKKSKQTGKWDKKDEDVVSIKTYSTYRQPTVEDASTTSDSVRGYKQRSGRKSKKGEGNGWTDSIDAASQQSWGAGKHGKKGLEHCTHERGGWTGREAPSEHSWNGDISRATNENSWDGFERVKTVSEVSVAGSGSTRSSLVSRASRPSEVSKHDGRGHEGSYNAGWGGSQASRQSWSSEKARVDDDEWGGSRRSSEKSRRSSNAGSGCQREEYADRFDDDNEVYLDEFWGGTPVRVESRQTSVVGWD